MIAIKMSYADWVYIGKESYDSRQVTRYSLKPGTNKFFDALGRVYSKMKAQIKYYVFKDAINKNEYEITKEFDVWARIIKDSDGNDVQLFVKEDKVHELNKDSSFYWNGYWEVFEFDYAVNETRYRASSGIKSLSKYDDKKRLKEYYVIDEKGDTLKSLQYEWKNGRLVRMTANGIVRNYIYGKTLQDTVRVEPSDAGFNYHRGYNGTAGKIPEEGTRDYEIFSSDPYGHVHFGEAEKDEQPAVNFAAEKSSSPFKVLGRVVTQNCISEAYYLDNMRDPDCVRFQKSDAFPAFKGKDSINILKHGYPSNELGPYYEMSYPELDIDHFCECNESGKYQPYISARTDDERIEVYLNSVRYDSSKKHWQECFWRKDDLLNTYRHETQHIRNARIVADNLTKRLGSFTPGTKEECEKILKDKEEEARKKWSIWFTNERGHNNPNSPYYSGSREPDVCR